MFRKNGFLSLLFIATFFVCSVGVFAQGATITGKAL